MTRTTTRRGGARLLTAAALASAAAAGAAGATAAPAAAQEARSAPWQSIMMDDDHLLYRSDETRDRTLDTMAAVGVDTVRATVLWRVVAGDLRSSSNRKRLKRYGPSDPRAYPPRVWDRYDNLVRSANARGMAVYFNVTGPGPRWAHATAPRSQRSLQRTWKPRSTDYRRFVTAVGRRFSGSYRDDDPGRTTIPRVSFWSLWNEPNQPGWLTPQWERGRPASPRAYRRLHLAGYRALKATGHAKDVILLGETAPRGRGGERAARTPLDPTTFLRATTCTRASGARLTGGSARAAGCGDFARTRRLPGTGWAHHPYTKELGPQERDPSRGALTIANLGTLPTLLDRVASRSKRIAADMPVYSTEFGWETNPPDPFIGIEVGKQAQWLMQAEAKAYALPRVVANTQFLLTDVKPDPKRKTGTRPYWASTYQSGLLYADGTAKPGYLAYAFPVDATPAPGAAAGAKNLDVWGMARFLPDRDRVPGLAAPTIVVQQRAGGGAWADASGPVTVEDPRGAFSVRVAVPAGATEVRAVLRTAGGDAPSPGAVLR